MAFTRSSNPCIFKANMTNYFYNQEKKPIYSYAFWKENSYEEGKALQKNMSFLAKQHVATRLKVALLS